MLLMFLDFKMSVDFIFCHFGLLFQKLGETLFNFLVALLPSKAAPFWLKKNFMSLIKRGCLKRKNAHRQTVSVNKKVSSERTLTLPDATLRCDAGVPGGVTPFPLARLSPMTLTSSLTETPWSSGGMSLLMCCGMTLRWSGGLCDGELSSSLKNLSFMLLTVRTR